MKRKSFLAYPYVIWSAIFIVIPLILVVLFSFTQEIDGKQVFSIANYKDLMDPIYFKVFFRSVILAGGSTLICLIVGYPVAYLVSKVNVSKRGTLILLFILPRCWELILHITRRRKSTVLRSCRKCGMWFGRLSGRRRSF